ncbi:MAG: methyltransferase domain-containing protein [Bryobacteraceae bacterium]
MLDYENQRKFLFTQRLWVLPALVGCLLLVNETWTQPPGISTDIPVTLLAAVLLWVAYYLPNYLGLDADAQRRPRWVAKSRLWLLLVMIAFTAGYQCWLALGAAVASVALHFVLMRWLRRPLPQDLSAPQPLRLALLAVIYAAADYTVLWLADRHGMPGIVAAEMWLACVFFGLVLLRPRLKESQLGVAILGATPAFALSVRWPTLVGSMLWIAGTSYLIWRAVRQNRENYETLVKTLGEYSREPREVTVQVMAEAGQWLADDWVRTTPRGQAEVNAWYTRVARRYLYHNCQHHLLYRHIVYTLGLLKMGRGRTLDFGGGNGNFSRALARRGFDVTYLDVPGEAADYVRWLSAREGLPVRVCHDLSEVAGPFDVIYSLDVVEHLVDMRPVGDAWRNLLKPGGLLVGTYYAGPCRTAPMHIDPGYDAKKYLLGLGFRDVHGKHVGVLAAELLRKPNFMVLDLPA